MLFKMCMLCAVGFIISVSSENILKFYKANFDVNPEHIENSTCNLKVVDRNTVLANVDYDLKLSMKNITARFQLFKFYNQFRPFLINNVFNLCKLLKNGDYYNFFVKLFYRLVVKNTNTFVCHHDVRIFFLF